MRSWPEVAAFAVLVASCGRKDDDVLPPGCPADSTLTWSTFGDAFLRSWCTGCHSSHLEEADRLGAPAGVDFDTLDGVRAHADAIGRRAVDQGDMPPAGGPSDGDRALLAEWLACGAPGVDGEPPTTAPTDPTGEGCLRTGHWLLSGAACYGVDATAGWQSLFPVTELDVRDDGAGGCTIDYHVADAGCDERQAWRSDLLGPTSSIEFLGTTACDPMGCTWAAIPDDDCQVLADPFTLDVPIADLANGAMAIGPLAPPDLASFCPAIGLVFVRIGE